MLTNTERQILAFLLSNQDNENTIRGIATKLNKSYPLVYNSISKLKQDNIVNERSIAHSKIISINLSHEIIPIIEISRRNELLKKHPWIKVMLEDIFIYKDVFFVLLVFGSYAKGTYTSKSDIDLLAIVPNKDDIQAIENSIKKAYTPIKKGLIIVDVNDFMTMIKKKEFNVGTEAIKNHIILYGIDSYYKLTRSMV